MGTKEASPPATADPLDTMAQALLGFGHPLRIRALVLLEYEQSPRALAEAVGAPLGITSYHVRMLRDYGLVELTRTEPARGALQHFYIRTDLADDLMAMLASRLGVPPRGPGRINEAKRLDTLTTWARLPD